MAKRTQKGFSGVPTWLSPSELIAQDPGSKAGVLKLLSALSSHLPGLDGLLNGKPRIRLDGDVLERFILGTADLLRALGVQMVLPKVSLVSTKGGHVSAESLRLSLPPVAHPSRNPLLPI
jgi:hypothetical protein